MPDLEKSFPKEKRKSVSQQSNRNKLFNFLSPVVTFALALLIGCIPIAMAGVNPLTAYSELIKGAFGSSFGLSETILKSAPLILAGLAFCFAARSGLFNIGGEGQLYMGALGSSLVGLFIGNIPSYLAIPLAILAGFLFGGLWAAIPAFLKANFGISEVITTIMFNYIAINIISFMIRGPLIEPPGYFPESAKLAESTWYPYLFGSRIHIGVVIAVAAALIVTFIIWKTPLGFRIRMVGLNPDAAEYAGVPVKRNVVLALLISGGIAGLAGTNEMLGIQHRLIEAFSPGYGFDAIAVSLLGQNHPIGIIISGILFSGLRAGAGAMQRAVGIPDAIVRTIQGLVVICVIAGSAVPAYLRNRAKKRIV